MLAKCINSFKLMESMQNTILGAEESLFFFFKMWEPRFKRSLIFLLSLEGLERVGG